MNFRRDKSKLEPSIDMAPMIDCVFLLLLFFVTSTTFISAPGIKLNLPEAKSQDIVHQKKDVTIVMRSNSEIFFNQKLVNLTELKTKLVETATDNSNALVIIQADTAVSHGRVVEVMDLAKEAGLHQLAIATQPKS